MTRKGHGTGRLEVEALFAYGEAFIGARREVILPVGRFRVDKTVNDRSTYLKMKLRPVKGH